MSNTNLLRKLVTSKLKKVCKNVFYENATEDNMYPHIVFEFSNTNDADIYRDDITMDIDIWDKGDAAYQIEEVTDAVCKEFNNKNEPTQENLPTFYLTSKRSIKDQDKTIKHRLVTVLIQNYESEEV